MSLSDCDVLWTLIVSAPAPRFTNVWPAIVRTSTVSAPAPVLMRVSVPAGVFSTLKVLLPAPRFSSRSWMPLNVIPPGWFAPTGPLQALASTSVAATICAGPPMQRFDPIPSPVMRNWFSGWITPFESFGPNGVASKNSRPCPNGFGVRCGSSHEEGLSVS
jgi:hypothetical protein